MKVTDYLKSLFTKQEEPYQKPQDPYKEFIEHRLKDYAEAQRYRDKGLRPRITIYCGGKEIGAIRGLESKESAPSLIEEMVRKCPNPSTLGALYNNPWNPSDRGDYSEGK